MAVEPCEPAFSEHVVPRVENCGPFWRAGTSQAEMKVSSSSWLALPSPAFVSIRTATYGLVVL